MASFNEIAGVPSHANRHLLTDILRNEWKYEGMVVSDWTGIWELINHGVAADSAQAGELAIHAGVDMDMVSEIYKNDLAGAVKAGRTTTADIDQAVRRVLRFKYRLGLFSDPYSRRDADRERTAVLTAENRATAREAGRRSIVLLKNDRETLPLRKDLPSIAVIGALAADTGAVIGNWAGLGRGEDGVAVIDGIRRAVSSQTSVRYARGASPTSNDTSGIGDAVRVAQGADAVVLVVGEIPDMSAEAESRSSLALPGAQEQLAEAVIATGKPVVVVLMNGRPLAIDRVAQTAPAILETWFLGVEHGNATTDVLFGDASPGGRMPISTPRTVGQVPIYYNHKNTGRPPTTEKYSSKYNDLPWTPLYPFGYGLSYTTFNYGAPRLSASSIGPNDSLRVEVDVTNTGRRAGDEVAQLYIRDDVGSVTRPVMQLRRFQRVTLAPGQRTTLRWSLGMNDLAFYDLTMRRVAEPGTFHVFTGSSSAETQSASFTLRGTASVPVPLSCP
jgi:beta-glucosidase